MEILIQWLKKGNITSLALTITNKPADGVHRLDGEYRQGPNDVRLPEIEPKLLHARRTRVQLIRSRRVLRPDQVYTPILSSHDPFTANKLLCFDM